MSDIRAMLSAARKEQAYMREMERVRVKREENNQQAKKDREDDQDGCKGEPSAVQKRPPIGAKPLTHINSDETTEEMIDETMSHEEVTTDAMEGTPVGDTLVQL